MQKDKKMILGYMAGGLLVLVIAPSIIFFITFFIDNIFRITIVQNSAVKWILIALLLITGLIYGIWSVIIQNTIGEGGPLEIGNLEISPKTKHLVVSGPYKNTRNPMLFGTFLMYLAYALIINSITAVIIVIAIFVLMLTFVVKMEEKRLLKDFGNQYVEYRKTVPRFFPWFQRKN